MVRGETLRERASGLAGTWEKVFEICIQVGQPNTPNFSRGSDDSDTTCVCFKNLFNAYAFASMRHVLLARDLLDRKSVV